MPSVDRGEKIHHEEADHVGHRWCPYRSYRLASSVRRDAGAVATQGQAIIAGTGNSEEVTTRLYNTTLPGCVLPFSDIGMSVCGGIGLTGGGTRVGVWGVTTDNSTGFGVEGSTVKGTGVFGHNSGSTGIGV